MKELKRVLATTTLLTTTKAPIKPEDCEQFCKSSCSESGWLVKFAAIAASHLLAGLCD